MYGKYGDSVLLTTAWALGSFLLSLVVLFSLFGVFLLGFLLIPLLPLVAVVMIVVMVLRGETSKSASDEAAPAEALTTDEVEAVTMPVLMPVVATVVEVEGACPIGRSIRVGEAWTLNGVWSDDGPCPRAERFLSQVAEQLRSGEAPGDQLWHCVGKRHSIVFQLRTTERNKALTSV